MDVSESVSVSGGNSRSVSGDAAALAGLMRRADEVGPEDAAPIEGWVASSGARDLISGGGVEWPLAPGRKAFELGAGVVGGRVLMESAPKSPSLATRRAWLKREPKSRARASKG